MLELHGKLVAEHIAALLEDREGERALMRATRADPEDVTQERLPFILEQVKLAAGEFAAATVRDLAKEELDKVNLAHEEELELIKREAEAQRLRSEAQAADVTDALVQERLERQQLQGQLGVVAAQLDEAERGRTRRELALVDRAFKDSVAAHRRMRWELVGLFAATSLWASTSATDWEPAFQLLSTFILTAFGFWFVPEFLEGLVKRHSMWVLSTGAARLGVSEFPSASTIS